jgi:hypothetical protein
VVSDLNHGKIFFAACLQILGSIKRKSTILSTIDQRRIAIMPTPNCMNTGKGRDFQIIAAKLLSDHFQVKFDIEQPMPIGNPPKNHKFDLVSVDLRFIGESKNYSWTEGGNVPSAKMGFINEAVFYLQHLPKDKKRFVVLRRDVDKKHTESIAEYYFRTNKHLLNGVFIIEIDILTCSIKIFEV